MAEKTETKKEEQKTEQKQEKKLAPVIDLVSALKTDKPAAGSPQLADKGKKPKPQKKEKGGIVERAMKTLKSRGVPEKEEKERVVKLSRVYNVPVRKLVSQTRRTKVAVHNLQNFVLRHTKAKQVKLSKEVNEKLWERSYKKPPTHIRVAVEVDDEGTALVKLHSAKE